MRKITSLTLIIAGFIELVTSVVLYIMPAGRVAYWTDYHFLGLSKSQWDNIHIVVGFLLLVMAAIHIYYNWRSITAYLKNKAKELTFFTKSFTIALILSLYVAVGTLYNLPPMNYVLQLGEHFTTVANKKYGEPPYGHAELSSLKMFCRKMNIDPAQAEKKLAAAGIKMKGVEESLLEMARRNDLSPQKLFDFFKDAVRVPEAGDAFLFPENPSPNFGNKTIEDICERYDLPLLEVMDKLKRAGLKARAGDTVKEISSSNDRNPMSIFEIIREVALKKE
ncbi:MAG TPA: DUF4405 domain-containing protein [Proteobacteria bacterium]|nr:DUF4405 domain-containing protein [Pseudomonadota bacterium]